MNTFSGSVVNKKKQQTNKKNQSNKVHTQLCLGHNRIYILVHIYWPLLLVPHSNTAIKEIIL